MKLLSLICVIVSMQGLVFSAEEDEDLTFFGVPAIQTPADSLPKPGQTIKDATLAEVPKEFVSTPGMRIDSSLPPELAAALTKLSETQKIVDEIFAKEIKRLREFYWTEMDKIANAADKAGKSKVVEFVDNKRLDAVENAHVWISDSPDDPPEWKAGIAKTKAEMDTLKKRRDAAVAKLVIESRAEIEKLQKDYHAKGDQKSASAAEQAAVGLQAWMDLQTSIWLGRTERSKPAGGSGGGKFLDCPPNGGLLIGFYFTEGNFSGHKVIASMTPLYLTAAGKVTGKTYGKRSKSAKLKKVEALNGYAVAGIIPNSGHRLDGFQLIFMRVQQHSAALDPKFRYLSEYVGGSSGGAHSPRGDDGRVVVGIYGRCGAEIDAMGIVQLKAGAQ